MRALAIAALVLVTGCGSPRPKVMVVGNSEHAFVMLGLEWGATNVVRDFELDDFIVDGRRGSGPSGRGGSGGCDSCSVH